MIQKVIVVLTNLQYASQLEAVSSGPSKFVGLCRWDHHPGSLQLYPYKYT